MFHRYLYFYSIIVEEDSSSYKEIVEWNFYVEILPDVWCWSFSQIQLKYQIKRIPRIILISYDTFYMKLLSYTKYRTSISVFNIEILIDIEITEKSIDTFKSILFLIKIFNIGQWNATHNSCGSTGAYEN